MYPSFYCVLEWNGIASSVSLLPYLETEMKNYPLSIFRWVFAYRSWCHVLDRKTSFHIILLALFFAVGVAARIFMAWAMMESSSSDHGVPCLMAKHIAEGRCFPIFYYGQPYMGSLEPAVSALFCKILGMNGFAVNLGTAFFGIALLPFVYAWARRAGGGLAGLSALLICVIGPFGFFQFQGWSYGGYAAIVFFCTLLVFWATWIAIQGRKSIASILIHYFGIGLAAGTAWWTAPHTLPAIMTAALIILAGLHRKLLWRRMILGVLGFSIGSTPFWVWNYHNNWETLAFLTPGVRSHVGEGIRIFFGSDILRAFGLPHNAFTWLGYTVSGGILCYLIYSRFKRRKTEQLLYLCTPLLYLVVASLLAGGSRFSGATAPERYLLHVIPPVAVLLGCVTQVMVKRLPFGVGLLPLFFLISIHMKAIPAFVKWGSGGAAYRDKIEHLETLLESHNIQHIYAEYSRGESGYALNFLLGEKFIFSDPMRERFGPYRRDMECSDSIAILWGLGGVGAFLESTGGKAQRDKVLEFDIQFDFQAPLGALIDHSGNLLSAVDSRGTSVKSLIMDGDLASGWHNQPNDEQPDWIEFRSDKPAFFNAVRLISEEGKYAHNMRIEWLRKDGQWELATDRARYSGYFWSGGRPYFRGPLFRQEFRFGPYETTGIRLYINTGDKLECSVSELRIYGVERSAPQSSNEPLFDMIRKVGLSRVYADRWMSKEIYVAFNGRISCSADGRVSESSDALLSPEMRWTRKTGVVASSAMVDTCRRTLHAAGFQFSEYQYGDLYLLYFGQNDWMDLYAKNRSFVWSGLGCLLRTDRSWGMYLSELSDHLKDSGECSEAIRLKEEALRLFPDIPDGMKTLEGWYRAAGNEGRAEFWLLAHELYLHEMSPSHTIQVDFSDGISLLGFTVQSGALSAGEPLDIDYYWSCPTNVSASEWSVFVHFVGDDDEIAFQDDHGFLANMSIIDQPVPMVFRSRRSVIIPLLTSPDQYRVRLGLYSPNKRKRMAVKTNLSHYRGSVELPVIVDLK